MAEFGSRFGIGKPMDPSLQERIDEIDQLVDDGRATETVTQDKIRVFFTVASAAIEDYLAQLVLFRVIDDAYQTTDLEAYIAQNVDEVQVLKKVAAANEDLAEAATRLEPKIQQVQIVRNKCVHGQTAPTEWQAELRPTATLAVEVVDDLHELVQESV